jgi:hypothetical protein
LNDDGSGFVPVNVKHNLKPSRRTLGLVALMLGLLASVCLGRLPVTAGGPAAWGLAPLPSGLAIWLNIGSVLAALVAVAGVVVAIRNPGDNPSDGKRVTGLRFGLIAGGAAFFGFVGGDVLSESGHGEFAPVWLCAVYGVYLVLVSRVSTDRFLVPLGVLMLAFAVGALAMGLTTGRATGAATVAGVGVLMLAYGLRALVHSMTPQTAAPANS